jgi:hypothetical protein
LSRTRLLHTVEAAFPEAGRYELFTGHKSARNLYLYRKLGYVEFKREPVSDALTIVFLEKRKSAQADDLPVCHRATRL